MARKSLLARLPAQIGQATVKATLYDVAHAALRFFDQSIPMGAAFFSDRTLLARHRVLLKARNAGPHRFNEAIASYLQAEQANGRIDAAVDASTVADILIGSCFMRAYWRQFIGEESSHKSDEAFIDTLLSTLPLEF